MNIVWLNFDHPLLAFTPRQGSRRAGARLFFTVSIYYTLVLLYLSVCTQVLRLGMPNFHDDRHGAFDTPKASAF